MKKKRERPYTIDHRFLKYAQRELGIHGYPVGLDRLCGDLSRHLDVPMPQTKEAKWRMLAAFWADDPKNAVVVYPRSASRAPQPRSKPVVAGADFLQSYEWRQLRMVALTQRGNRCECCGASPSDGVTVLNVDHIKPRLKYPELALDLSNLQILCAVCNHGKGNWSERDWRTPRLVARLA